jgi:glycosyltransferase involved in cell wall biosynthesis
MKYWPPAKRFPWQGFCCYATSVPTAAQVIYLGRRLETGAAPAYLEQAAGRPFLLYLAGRLQAATGIPLYVLCHEGETARLLEPLAPGAEVVAGGGSHRLECLRELAGRVRADTLLVYAGEAAFPDCERALRMLEIHAAEHADATVGEDYPPGMLPEIVEAGALQRLIALGAGPAEAGSIAAAMEKANRQAKHGKPAFRLRHFLRDHRSEPELVNLPATLLLSTGNARAAAGQVIREAAGEPGPGIGPALRFGEILRLLDERPAPPAARRRTAAKRILFATLADLYAGAEESFFLLVSRIDRTRYEPVALTPGESLLARKLREAGIEVVVPGVDAHRVNPASLRWFGQFLDAHRPDLVHIDSFAFPSLVLPAWLRKIPVLHHVRVIHGRNCPETYKFAARVVAISEAVRLDLLRNGIRPEAIATIPNGLDLSRFQPVGGRKAALRAQRGIPADAFVLAMAARIAAEKRQHFVAEALPDLLKRVPEAMLLLAGETYEWQLGYRRDLERTISRLDIEKQVLWLGYERDAEKIYGAADVTVLATEEEAFGRCLVESMAMEVPVVAPARKGPAEIVTHRSTGLLFDPLDAPDFVAQVASLHSDPGLYRTLAENGRRRAEEFSLERHVERMEALWKSVLEEKRS